MSFTRTALATGSAIAIAITISFAPVWLGIVDSVPGHTKIPTPESVTLAQVSHAARPDLHFQSEDSPIRSASAGVPAVRPASPQSQEALRLRESKADALRALREAREDKQLMAAGFTSTRIAWIRSHTRERKTASEQAMMEDVRQGRPFDPNKMAALMFDPELVLIDEFGSGEFERYRDAIGRPKGVHVLAVQQGSNAESSGVRAGDDIVRYDGQRVFNVGQLMGLVRTSNPKPAQVTIEVERNNGLVHLTAGGGELGLQTATVPAISRQSLTPGQLQSLP